MQGFFGLPPDRRTKRMPQSLQAPLPLAVYPFRIALHRIALSLMQLVDMQPTTLESYQLLVLRGLLQSHSTLGKSHRGRISQWR